MSDRRSVRGAILGRSRGYSLFRRLLRADRATNVLVREHIRPPAGGRVLDLGCGNGELVDHLGDVDYVGIDHNVDYIRAARHELGLDPARVTFISADLADLATLDLGRFDVVTALGVLHHLDTELAAAVIAGAASVLRPGGRLVTLDPAFHPEQRTIARVLMAMDRGLYVRHPEDYMALVARSFASTECTIRTDLVPIPYTHCIIEAQQDPDAGV